MVSKLDTMVYKLLYKAFAPKRVLARQCEGIGAAHAATAGTRPKTIPASFWCGARRKLISREAT